MLARQFGDFQMTGSFVLRAAVLALVACSLSGCLAVAATGAVVGTAVGVTGAAVKGAAKGTGMVVGAVIPGGGDKKDR
jgi:O-antigen ligase